MSPILIVGAGPVGLTLAAELARYRVPVRLIDKSPHPSQTSKALVLWARTLELLDRAGCTQAFLDAGIRGHGASLRVGTTQLGHARFDSIASQYNYALMIPQTHTERVLADHLRTFGVTVEREVTLTAFTPTETAVHATLTHVDGRTETVETPFLLGTDGAHSTVRHGLGIQFEGSTRGDSWVLADVRLEGPGAPVPDEVTTWFHRDGPFVVFPMPGGRARVIASFGDTDPDRPRQDPTLQDIQTIIDARTGGGFHATDPVWLSNFRINERKVDEYRHGRVILAGDAAHIHSPAGGQGMNTGMQDAINLAWKLAMTLHNQVGPAVLDSYSPERNAVGDMVLRNAGRLTEVATLSNPAAQFARNLALRILLGLHTLQDRMATNFSEIEIAYPESPLSRGRHAGTRLPPERYHGPPPGAGDTPRFLLFTTDPARGAALSARFPTLLDPTPRPTHDADELLIVRPDAYIGFAGHAAAWAEAETWLTHLAP